MAVNCVQLFLRFDKNRNRVLEKEEIEGMLRSLGIRPRPAVVDKVCLFFGMDSWQITYNAFAKTLPKNANEKILYDMLAQVLPEKDEVKPKRTKLTEELMTKYEKPEQLPREELVEGITFLVSHHKLMMEKLIAAHEQKHLYTNQLRQYHKQEEVHEEWREKLKQENVELTDMIGQLNDKLTQQRKDYTKKLRECQGQLAEATKNASSAVAQALTSDTESPEINVIQSTPPKTSKKWSSSSRVVKPLIRPVIKRPAKGYSRRVSLSPREALQNFNSQLVKKREKRIPHARWSISESASSSPGSFTISDDLALGEPPDSVKVNPLSHWDIIRKLSETEKSDSVDTSLNSVTPPSNVLDPPPDNSNLVDLSNQDSEETGQIIDNHTLTMDMEEEVEGILHE